MSPVYWIPIGYAVFCTFVVIVVLIAVRRRERAGGER